VDQLRALGPRGARAALSAFARGAFAPGNASRLLEDAVNAQAARAARLASDAAAGGAGRRARGLLAASLGAAARGDAGRDRLGGDLGRLPLDAQRLLKAKIRAGFLRPSEVTRDAALFADLLALDDGDATAVVAAFLEGLQPNARDKAGALRAALRRVAGPKARGGGGAKRARRAVAAAPAAAPDPADAAEPAPAPDDAAEPAPPPILDDDDDDAEDLIAAAQAAEERPEPAPAPAAPEPEPDAPEPAAPAPEPAAPEPEEPAPESDPEPAPRLTEAAVLRMTVRELKVHLEERDLETKGLKAALQKRLLASLAE